MKIKVRGVWAENERGIKESKVINTTPTEGFVRDWVPVHAEQEYVIIIEITKELCGFKVKKSETLFLNILLSSIPFCRRLYLIASRNLRWSILSRH